MQCTVLKTNISQVYSPWLRPWTQIQSLWCSVMRSVNSSFPGQNAAILRTIISGVFLRMKNVVFWLEFHWRLIAKVQYNPTLVHHLHQCWHYWLTHIWGTRGRWVLKNATLGKLLFAYILALFNLTAANSSTLHQNIKVDQNIDARQRYQ